MTTVIAVTAAAVALVAFGWQWVTRRKVRSLDERRLARARAPERAVERGGPGPVSAVAGGRVAETQTPGRTPQDVPAEPTVLLPEPGATVGEAAGIVPGDAAGRTTDSGSESPEPIEEPIESMGRSGASVLELLDDDHPQVRRNAVAALAAGGGAHALRGLWYAAARDPAVEVRREAILGIRSLVERRSAPAEGGSS